jgi:hypothetical protein
MSGREGTVYVALMIGGGTNSFNLLGLVQKQML